MSVHGKVEILCKYLVGLYDIQDFLTKALAEYKISIIASTNEGVKYTVFLDETLNLVICVRFTPLHIPVKA